MPAANRAIKKTQLVTEVTPGTPLAATWQLIGDTEVTHPKDREFEDFPRGVYAPYTGGGVDLRNASLLEHNGNLTYEELPHMLAATLVNPTVSGAGPYVYTSTRGWTAPPTLKAYTAEIIESDGTTKHVEDQISFLTGREIDITIARGAVAKVKWSAFGRKSAIIAGTSAAGLAALTGRSPIASDLFKFYMDDTWAGLGATQKSTVIRAANLKINGGAKPGYALDGRSALDLTHLEYDTVTGSLSITCELASYAAAEIVKYEAHALRFVRLIATDGTKIAQFDLCAVHKSEPKFSSDGNVRLATFDMALEYDPTGANVVKPVITNSLATLAAV